MKNLPKKECGTVADRQDPKSTVSTPPGAFFFRGFFGNVPQMPSLGSGAICTIRGLNKAFDRVRPVEHV